MATNAMFTLCEIVKRSGAGSVPDRAFFHTKNSNFGTGFALEQEKECYAPVVKCAISLTQRRTYSCSHCTGSVSATLFFTIGLFDAV